MRNDKCPKCRRVIRAIWRVSEYLEMDKELIEVESEEAVLPIESKTDLVTYYVCPFCEKRMSEKTWKELAGEEKED